VKEGVYRCMRHAVYKRTPIQCVTKLDKLQRVQNVNWHESLCRRRGQSVPPTFAEIYIGCQSDSVLSINFQFLHIRHFTQDSRVI